MSYLKNFRFTSKSKRPNVTVDDDEYWAGILGLSPKRSKSGKESASVDAREDCAESASQDLLAEPSGSQVFPSMPSPDSQDIFADFDDNDASTPVEPAQESSEGSLDGDKQDGYNQVANEDDGDAKEDEEGDDQDDEDEDAEEDGHVDVDEDIVITGGTAVDLANRFRESRCPGDPVLVVHMPPGEKPQWKVFSITRHVLSYKPVRFDRTSKQEMSINQRSKAYKMHAQYPDDEKDNEMVEFDMEDLYIFGRFSDDISLTSSMRGIMYGPRATFFKKIRDGEDRVKAYRDTVQEYPEPYLWSTEWEDVKR